MLTRGVHTCTPLVNTYKKGMQIPFIKKAYYPLGIQLQFQYNWVGQSALSKA